MKKGLLLWLFAAISTLQVLGQSRTITGKVTDAKDGSPLPGVTVKVTHGATGTLTTATGEFKLTVAENTSSLEFSFIGYATQQLNVAGKSIVNVKLATDEKGLSEVVVVGYGTVERKNLTASVSSIKGASLKNAAAPSIDRQLAGQVAGVQATVSSGMLGQPARIRIRGTNSISSSADPLYVIDGVPYITGSQSGITPNNPLGDINPNDIESMEVLKDGAATAIYGSRASNGVILVTTKRGKSGKARLTYDSWLAAATPSKRFKLLNADEFVMINNEKLFNADPSDPEKYANPTPNPAGGFYDTDWQKVVTRTGFQQNHALSMSGATDQTNYYVSLGYTDMKGILVGNDQTKYQVRLKVEQKVLDVVTVGVNAGVSYIKNNGLNTSQVGLSSNLANAMRAFPNVPAQWNDGSYNLSTTNTLGSGANKLVITDNYTNIKYVLDHNIYRNQSLNFTGNTFASVKILKNFDLRTQLGINYLNGEDYQYWNSTHGDGKNLNGLVFQQSIPNFRYNWVNTLSYNKTIGSHYINAVVGMENQKTRERSFSGQGTNLTSPFFGTNNLIDNSVSTHTVGGNILERAFQSYFVRANYGFKDRYLISGTLRRDAISSLPIGKQNVTLPGVSVGWRVSQENFFQNTSWLNFVSNLKLRGGYAKVGNVEIGAYPYAGTYKPSLYGSFLGVAFNQVYNPDLTFETSKKMNVGFDMAFLKDRITFTADYFKNDIDNMILASPLPPSLGVPSSTQPNVFYSNVGKMYNKGFEFTINSLNIQKGDFTWSTSFNLSFVKNRVTALVDGADIVYPYNLTRVGESLGAFYGYESAGVNPANGNQLWVKGDGTVVQAYQGADNDKKNGNYYAYDPANPGDVSKSADGLSAKDKKILGQATPTYYGGLNNTVTYKGFDFNIFLSFSGGNKVYNVTSQEGLSNMKFQNNGKVILDRWTTPGQVTDVPKLHYGSDNFVLQSGNMNSRFLEDGSFIRAQNIGLGYSLPKKMLDRMKLNNFRIYAQVQNAFVITKYSGLDPELNTYVDSKANTQPGLDYNTNPVPRSYTFGINVGL
ncbi:SusC/RagA family TonB-linked outer membrane protein [Chitinophaga nivalis]|uniref:TonB-dependent receptor n=1 Tax=Chitinophaga nivalis TaxID=2991709 RepID=A0ABT3IUD5_9BACT|nr:TonB-dependent receptor [Chitinophaga nivalis]MCW3462721.1 TonB-dependent receptor [Chitinophaga nivalis]MCW3487588.1 TonB-dependent receptor [Chitinophaga nivalis]